MKEKEIELLKSDIENLCNKAIRILSNAKIAKVLAIHNDRIKEITDKINNNISEGIMRLNKLADTLKYLKWEKFYCAFFGETNAGKSTLIEALIGGDGSSIGRGFKDFTKEIKYYTYPKNNHIVFIDMPGIEGNEFKYINQIYKALKQSHIIFYVLTDNKEPEEGTLEKVKQYLGKELKVYVIVNYRGIYQYGKTSTDENRNFSLIIERIDKKMREKLGSKYERLFVCDALLAFLSRGKIEDLKYEKYKTKALKVFKTCDEMEKVSKINEIEELLNNLEKNSDKVKINTIIYKLLKEIERTISSILTEKKNLDLIIKEFMNMFYESKRKIVNIKRETETELEIVIHTKIDNLKNALCNIIYSNIDQEQKDHNKIKLQIESKVKEFENEMGKILDAKVNEMKDEINKEYELLKEKFNLKMELTEIKSEINIREIIDKLNVSFDYVLKEFVNVLLTIGQLILTGIGPFLGIIIGIIYGIKKLWDWFFGDPEKRKREAKKKAYHEVTNTTEKMKRKIMRQFKTQINSVWDSVFSGLRDYENAIRNLTDFENLNKIINDLKLIKSCLLLRVLKYFGINAVGAYVDLQLKKLLIITNEKFTLPEGFLKIENNDIITLSPFQLNEFLVNDAESEFVKRASSVIKHIMVEGGLKC